MNIAIIGFGPRGLACLENLVLELASANVVKPHLFIFEPSANLGTGKAWEIDQPETNYINISDHALQNLKGREKLFLGTMTIPSFPSYTQWCLNNNKEENIAGDKDVYPSRSQMGNYLHQRATSICSILSKNKALTIINEKVVSVTCDDDIVKIKTAKDVFNASECLITIGHTPTEDSEETVNFKAHGKKEGVTYIHDPYEAKIARKGMANTKVVIKGFGLSMLDIARQLTNYKFGTFEEKSDAGYLQFLPNKDCVQEIIPYSNDGLPCVPKPFGRKVDATFEPTLVQKNTFELALRNHLATPKALQQIDFVLDAFSEVAAAIYIQNSEEQHSEAAIKTLTVAWLKDPSTAHELILDTELPTIDYMRQTVEMAWGNESASLDFTIGQVWRHLQPSMYRLFAFSGISGELIKQLIEIDQDTKRYSYGPPVESILQLIALHEAEILNLDYVNDPTIELVAKGWKLSKKDSSVVAPELINSVMDAPVLEKMESPIFKELYEKECIQPVHEDLGILTHPDGTVVHAKDAAKKIPISVVGRNAKGSVLGTDAILECFSPETHDWAKGVVSRMGSV